MAVTPSGSGGGWGNMFKHKDDCPATYLQPSSSATPSQYGKCTCGVVVDTGVRTKPPELCQHGKEYPAEFCRPCATTAMLRAPLRRDDEDEAISKVPETGAPLPRIVRAQFDEAFKAQEQESFAEYPVSLAERRSAKSDDASQWTPRDCLIALLRDIDSGKKDVTDVVICVKLRSKGGPNSTHSTYYNSSTNYHVMLGLMTDVQFDMQSAAIDDGKD